MGTVSKILVLIFRALIIVRTAGQLGFECLNLLQKGTLKLEKWTAIAQQ